MGVGLAALDRAIDHVALRGWWRRQSRQESQHQRQRRGQQRRWRRRWHQSRGLQLSGLRSRLQAEEQPAQPPEVGVRQGAAVPVSPLRLPSQAEDAHRPAHGAHAQREDLQAGDGLGRRGYYLSSTCVCEREYACVSVCAR